SGVFTVLVYLAPASLYARRHHRVYSKRLTDSSVYAVSLHAARPISHSSCKISRSRSMRSHMARDANCGRSVKRQLRGPRSTDTSSKSPAVRPIASDPKPRVGSCGRCKLSPVSPAIISAARAISVPGTGPNPNAVIYLVLSRFNNRAGADDKIAQLIRRWEVQHGSPSWSDTTACLGEMQSED